MSLVPSGRCHALQAKADEHALQARGRAPRFQDSSPTDESKVKGALDTARSSNECAPLPESGLVRAAISREW